MLSPFLSQSSSTLSSVSTSPRLRGIRRLRHIVNTKVFAKQGHDDDADTEHPPSPPPLNNALSIFYHFLSHRPQLSVSADESTNAESSNHRRALCSMLEMMSAEAGLESVMDCVINAARALVNTSGVALFMVDHDRQIAICKAHSQLTLVNAQAANHVNHDAPPAHIIGKRYALGEGIVGAVAQSKKCVVYNDIDKNTRIDTVFGDVGLPVHSLLCVPILDAQKYVRAVLLCVNRIVTKRSALRRNSSHPDRSNSARSSTATSPSSIKHNRHDSAPADIISQQINRAFPPPHAAPYFLSEQHFTNERLG